MKKQIGVWLDFKEAYIINLGTGETDFKRISSDIDTGHVKGGARSKVPWGPMDKTSESKILKRRKHQEHKYYQILLEQIRDADALYVFGPAEAKNGLKKEIGLDPNFKGELKGVETADSMTKNQMIAQVKAFFGKNGK